MRNSLITATRTTSLLLVWLSMLCWSIPRPQIAACKMAAADRQSANAPLASAADQSRVRALVEKMPLQFIENSGQVDPSVAYYVQGRDTSLYFSNQGITFTLEDKAKAQSIAKVGEASPLNPLSPLTSSPSVNARRAWPLRVDFVDANPLVKLKGEDATPTIVNYFKGKRDQWRTGIPTYRKLVYENLWRGIDLVYSGDNEELKYSFAVKPGADPDQIRLAYRGATAIGLNAGRLEVTTPVRSFKDDKPYSYQETSAGRIQVATAYELESTATESKDAYRFRVGTYDRNKPLIIDPAIIVYAGYLGGDHEERALGIAVDNVGNAYVTGESTSTSASFPTTTGSFLSSTGGQDAFVAKLNAAGSAFIYCAYIGGAGDDVGFGIAADSAGNAYVTGATSSTEASFPVKTGPDLTYNGGSFDAFVAKIDPTGTALVYCGYIGGAGADGAAAIAVDSGGNAYVSGGTNSTEASFPISVGPDLTFNGGVLFGDAFVARVNATGNGLAYCGYIGGAAEDAATGIAVDANGNAYVTGGTNSSEGSFPVKVGPDLTYNGGLRDGWVAKVNTGGSTLAYCGYIGGNGADLAYDIAVDSAGSAYVTGETSSTEASFPVKIGPDLTYNGGSFDAFVAKVNSSGSDLAYAGYIGGSGRDWAAGIAIDGAGNAYVTGASHSNESSFPVLSGPDLTFNGGPFYGDAFVAKIAPAGTTLVYCSYIGGDNDDVGYGIAVDSHRNVYIAGETSSTQLSFPVVNGPDSTYNGGVRDGFVVKLVENEPPVARCHDVIKIAEREVSPQDIDAGSSDPEGDPITLSLSPAGPYALGTTTVTLTATDDRGAARQCTADITIKRGTPKIVWTNPSDILYGTRLGAGQLSATASFNNVAVPGAFIYTPAPDTVLSAGPARTLSATFTPDDTTLFDQVGGTVVINVLKAPLTVVADNKSKLYGSPNPNFTARYSGFVLNQNPSVLSGALVFTTAATASSNVGTYQVTPGGLSSPNYAISFASGALQITPAPLVITADNQLKIIGAPNPTFTATYSGFVLGQNSSVLSGRLSFSTPAATTTNVGNYSVMPGGLTSANYALTYVAGRLTVSYNILLVVSGDGDDDDEHDDGRGEHGSEHDSAVIPQLCAATRPCTLVGDTEQLRLKLVDATGRNLSAATVTLHVQSLQRVTPAGLVPVSSHQDFRFEMRPHHQPLYSYQADDLQHGTYLLRFTTGADPTFHAVQFNVR